MALVESISNLRCKCEASKIDAGVFSSTSTKYKNIPFLFRKSVQQFLIARACAQAVQGCSSCSSDLMFIYDLHINVVYQLTGGHRIEIASLFSRTSLQQ